jgi:predicted ferric reductase
MPYASGLAGVNTVVDNISSESLWATVAFVFLVVLLIRLAQRGNAHLRHLTSLGAKPGTDRYWSRERNSWWPSWKNNLFYAPLNKKRHHREMQLSKAINVGTIPSRLQTLILVVYLFSNVAYCCWVDYSGTEQAALLAEIRGRTGHLSVINMVGLFLLAGRNNPLIRLFRISFDTFNLFHRWIGRIVVLQAVAHTVAWAMNNEKAHGWSGIVEIFQTNAFIQYGLLGTGAMTLILFQSPSAVRHAFYETFLHIHQLLALLALVGVYYHAKLGPLPQKPYVIAIMALWSYDRIFRLARILYRNFNLRRGLTTVTVEALPGEACRVTFDLRRPWTDRPGCHVYAYLPSISLWMSHPFSIAWTETRSTPYLSLEDEKLPSSIKDLGKPLSKRTTTSVSLIMSKRTGMTAKLYDMAAAAPSKTIYLRGALEGPYGGLESLHSYGTVVLFAGGVGITHQIGHIRDLLAGHAAGTVAVRRITLVWAVRTSEQLEWVRPWMDRILAMQGRRDVLKVLLFVTKPKSARDVVSASERVRMFPGRPKPVVLIEKEFRERVGAMVVGVCGPGALADDVRAATWECVQFGKVDFWEEGFTW